MRLRLAAIAVLVALVGCIGSQTDASPGEEPGDEAPLVVTSSAFADRAPIPTRYTCDGQDLSPPLTVDRLSAEAASVALVVGDPDVPTPTIGAENLTHWLAWNAEPADGRVQFPEDAVPNGTRQGENDAGGQGYTGPCPPPGSPPHRYVFRAFAVDTHLALEEGANRSQLEAALQGHVLDEARLVGTYERDPVPASR